MFCHNCGNQVPDGSSFCPMCGRTLSAPASQPEQQAYTQPTYTQPQQPVYTQPQQNAYTQPVQPVVYAQPVKKQNSALKIILIVLAIVIGLPIVLFCGLVGCALCGVCAFEDEIDSGYNYEYDADDFDFDLDLDGFDFDGSEDAEDTTDPDVVLSAEFSPEMLVGTWNFYDKGETAKITDNKDGTFTVKLSSEVIEYLEYIYSDELKEATLSECAPMAEPLYSAVLTLVFEGSEAEVEVCFGNDMLQFYIINSLTDASTYFGYVKDITPENSKLADAVIGTWKYAFSTYEIEKGGAGAYYRGSDVTYFDWTVVDDFLILYYPDLESIEVYRAAVDEDGKLVLAYISCDDPADVGTSEWFSFKLKPTEAE